MYTNPDHYYTSGFECCPHRSGNDNASATNVTSTPTAQGGAASNISDCATAADEAACGRTPGCAWQRDNQPFDSGDCVAAEADAEAEVANSTSAPTTQGGEASNTSDIDLHVWGPTCSWTDGDTDTPMGVKPVDRGGTEEARCHQEHHWVHSLLGRSTPDWAFGRASGSR